MVMDLPSPKSVGREFVRQYYTMLHEAPDYLYRFYSHNSSFLHGGMDHSEEEQLPAVGQSEINKKISSLKFHDCHAKIRQVDSQWSIGGSVVIQVVGELSNNGSAMRQFTQTFVLGQQNPKKYYVHNDIFRYQDEVLPESGNETEITNEAGEAEGMERIDDGHHVPGAQGNEVDGTYYENAETIQEATNGQVSNGSPLEEELVTAGNSNVEEVAETQLEFETLVVAKVTEEVKPEVEAVVAEAVEDGLPNPEPFPKKEAVQDAEEPRKTLPSLESGHAVAAPQKPTWAAMASKFPTAPPAPSTAVSTGTCVYAPKPQAAIRPELKTDTNPVAAGLPQRAPRGPRTDVAQDGYRGALDGGDDAGRNMQQYPDNQQVFVGNLPRNLADKDLREFFEKFGGVLDMRINRKPNNNNLPNFGFVVFDSPETVQKVLNERPLLFNGKHRVNVEEKKPREELAAARPRSATHIVGKPGAGRGTETSTAWRGTGRQNAASGGPRNYAKGTANDESKATIR